MYEIITEIIEDIMSDNNIRRALVINIFAMIPSLVRLAEMVFGPKTGGDKKALVKAVLANAVEIGGGMVATQNPEYADTINAVIDRAATALYPPAAPAVDPGGRHTPLPPVDPADYFRPAPPVVVSNTGTDDPAAEEIEYSTPQDAINHLKKYERVYRKPNGAYVCYQPKNVDADSNWLQVWYPPVD